MHILGMTKAEKRRAMELALTASTEYEELEESLEETIGRFVKGAKTQLEVIARHQRACTFPVPWLQEYLTARDRYHSIHPRLRWLFPRLRKRYEALLLKQQQVTLNAVIEWSKGRVFVVGDDCRLGNCACGCVEFDGVPIDEAPELPRHEGCDCYFAAKAPSGHFHVGHFCYESGCPQCMAQDGKPITKENSPPLHNWCDCVVALAEESNA